MSNDPLVAEVYKLHGTCSISLGQDTPLGEVISTFTKRPSICGIFLIDANQHFVSMITRTDLTRWVHLQLSGGKGMDSVPIWAILQLGEARKAKDIAMSYQRTLSVKEADTLQRALDQMLSYEEDIVPVLDQEGKVLGDLRLSEILSWFIASGKLKQ